jgi:phospholipase C
VRRHLGIAALGAAAAAVFACVGSAGAASGGGGGDKGLGHFKHLVVIYEENHSFDNLFGGWGEVGGKSVDGIDGPGYAARATQIGADGHPLPCLPQNDVNLTSPPLDTACGSVPLANGSSVGSHFGNQPFDISSYIGPTATTCPAPNVSAANGVPAGQGLPGGCTRDLVHRFYNEQFQIDGGKMDRYTLGSDAMGLTQGRYDTTALPVYQYLHAPGAPGYVVADRFFQGAFGGSFLNHQYLIAARAPQWAGWTPAGQAHSVLDANGMPGKTPLYAGTGADNALTQQCDLPGTVAGYACGDFAVNTVQPMSQPYSPGTAAAKRLPAVDDSRYPTIGDELSAKNVSWAWYAGGWDNAAGNVGGPGWTNGSTPGSCTDPDHKSNATYPYCAGNLFQFHHQPFNYFANYGEGAPGRAHLQDEQAFLSAAHDGTLPSVSFVKPYGEENEHPGYASTENGESHLVDLLKTVENGPEAGNTLVVVTYDEFGGQWDHVPPPGLAGAAGAHDAFGPGTRIPALIVGRSLQHDAVDSTPYDTTSILRTIETMWGVAPLGTRDGSVNDLGHAIEAARPNN